MIEHKPIFLRAHTEIAKLPTGRGTKTAKPELDQKAEDPTKRARPSKWPEYVLAFDCETTTDSCQALTFGTYQFCRTLGDQYECIEEGIFYADEVPEADPQGLEVLRH